MLKATVEFANGTAITDKFSDKDDFNLWVKNAIADFGNIVYIEILPDKREEIQKIINS